MSSEILEKVRTELILTEEKPCCRYPFLSGAVRGAGELIFTRNGFALWFRHIDGRFIEKLTQIVNDLTGERLDCEHSDIDMGDCRGKGEYYILKIPSEIAADLLEKCGIVENRVELVDDIPEALRKKPCYARAYLRGLYLACGHLSLPENGKAWEARKTRGGYGVTFSLNSGMVRNAVRSLIAKCAMIDESKILIRENADVLYIKTAEAVSAALAAVGSSSGVLMLESLMAERQLKNDLNRRQNFDMANINKQLSAGMKQCEDIRIIEENSGLESLPSALADVCRLRLENPEANLEDLGEMFNPPLSKSCINHRLRRISEIADAYRK